MYTTSYVVIKSVSGHLCCCHFVFKASTVNRIYNYNWFRWSNRSTFDSFFHIDVILYLTCGRPTLA